jgi:hypothetical protein
MYTRTGQGNVVDIASFLDSSTYTYVNGSGWEEVHSWTLKSSQLRNSAYNGNAVIISFDFWATGTTTNDFAVYLDGVSFFTFDNHNSTQTSYKVFLPIKNTSIDHTIGIYTNNTVSSTNNVTNMAFTVIARLNG